MSVPAEHDKRERLGFPPRTTFLDLRVSIPARCVVVVAQITDDPIRSDRIYLREYSANVYREVAWPDGCNSWGEPVLSHCAAELFVLGEAWRDTTYLPSRGKPGGTTRGGGPVGLYRVRLPLGETEFLHRAAHSPDPASDEGHWTLSKLLALTPDGARLAVRMAVGRRESGTTKWDYRIAILDPFTGLFEDCTDLPAVFA